MPSHAAVVRSAKAQVTVETLSFEYVAIKSSLMNTLRRSLEASENKSLTKLDNSNDSNTLQARYSIRRLYKFTFFREDYYANTLL